MFEHDKNDLLQRLLDTQSRLQSAQVEVTELTRIVLGFSIVPVASAKDASAIYIEALPVFAAHNVELLDVPKLITELRLLERRTRAGGKDVVSHPPRGSDDVANSTCGSLWLAPWGSWGGTSART